jgi:nickel-dependent lactate racemase
MLRGRSNAEMLVPIVDDKAGVPDGNITVIAALGLHRKMKQDELDTTLGPLKGKIKIVNHDCEKNLQTIGKTSLGTQVYLNKTFLEADVKILTGDVEYHQFCGYGGGAKSVFPGLGDGESITLSHSRMELEGTGAGRLKGNPIREEIDEIGRKVGVDFIVNVVINSDKKISAVFAGDVYKALGGKGLRQDIQRRSSEGGRCGYRKRGWFSARHCSLPGAKGH